MSNEKGLSLVEVMIALVVLLFVSLALMQTALVSIESNTKNSLRDEAVSIAEARMSEAKQLTFTQSSTNLLSDDVATKTTTQAACPPGFWSTFQTQGGVLVQRNIRNTTFTFCTNRTVTEYGGDGSLTTPDAVSRGVTITVGWMWKGDEYSHSLTSMVERQ